MKKVQRAELLDYATYSDRREAIRARVLEVKAPRRVHVGPHLTFLFENIETMTYQVQEMMRVERIVRDADIQHEVDTYNELLGGDGELGCTLLIEITDPEDRDQKLTAWMGLVDHLYVVLEGGRRAKAIYDARQVGETRLSSVQYLRFDTSGETPVGIGCDFPAYIHEAVLDPAQRSALEADLQL